MLFNRKSSIRVIACCCCALFSLCFSTNSATAQQLHFGGGLTTNGLALWTHANGSELRTEPHFGLLLHAGFTDSLGERWRLGGELEYMRTHATFHTVRFLDSVTVESYTTSSHLGYLFLPVSISYSITPRLFIGSGLEAGYLLHANVGEQVWSEELGLYNPDTKEVENHSSWMASGRLILGLKWKRYSLTAGYRHGLTPAIVVQTPGKKQINLKAGFIKFSYFPFVKAD